jgi:hypothetical protein
MRHAIQQALTVGALACAACAPAPSSDTSPEIEPGGRMVAPEPVVRLELPAGSALSGACGRLQVTRDYQARLRDLIALIEADGVTEAERADLMRAYSRLHGAQADAAQAAADVAAARYRLEALTGGAISASELPACE